MGAGSGALDPDRLFGPVAGFGRIGLAVSGGADSLALLVLFARWKPSGKKPAAVVYTVDHGLRPEAQAETAFVADIAARFGLKARILHWRGEKPTSGVQAGARQARYRLMGAAMAEDGAAALLTAHHQQDQAETVLMRIAHGSGVSGLGGMRAWSQVEGVTVFRPLLDIDPAALRAAVEDAGLSAVEDPSNEDRAYERVRWRQVLPELAGMGLSTGRLSAMARRIARADDLADSIAGQLIAHSARRDGFGLYRIAHSSLLEAHAETRVRVLALLVESACGGARPGLAQIEEVAADLEAGEDWQGRTLGGVKIERRGDDVLVYREMGRIAPDPLMLEPGKAIIWDGRFSISAHAPDLHADAGFEATRAGIEKLVGPVDSVPMAAIRAAPMIRQRDGRVLAIGEHVFSPMVEVRHVALTPLV